ncbi:signal transduction histidine kinase [Chitinophaga niastensis]|uniref:histidine kinase n=1 Tax=Chitinophaga niastensis TaxID=536980 RepID=A0A2P8HEJ8_CHINA|nr:ATP-binding protein [Chitinophaga niastensis]PSL44633.1 signal transduction histidine kinase [Chitinophaga niastensis]
MIHLPISVNLVILVLIILEIAIFVHQSILYFARPHEKGRLWHTLLIGLLILYNFDETLFMLPDPHIPLPYITQGIISESTGYFVTAYIPFYAYKTMNFKGDRTGFHGWYGWLFVLIPTLTFFFIYYPISENLLLTRRYVFIIPGLYAITALYATGKWIFMEYKEDNNRIITRERLYIFLAIIFWCTQPLVGAFAGAPKWIVGLFSNVFFLVLNAFFMRQLVRKSRREYNLLQESNRTLSEKVRERTAQLEASNEQRTNTFVNLVHETKTPITLINNYLEEYIAKYGHKKELTIVKNSIDKLNRNISNLFELERYNKGFIIYDHAQLTDFSQVLSDNLILFKSYCNKKNLVLLAEIEEDVWIKADPDAINAIVINVIENAIKFTCSPGKIRVTLATDGTGIYFIVKDNGIGIHEGLRVKIFEPYYQINSLKGGFQGMGLGLPIVKKTVDDLKGQISTDNNPDEEHGTIMTIVLNRYIPGEKEDSLSTYSVPNYSGLEIEITELIDTDYNDQLKTILIIEDNRAMIHYLFSKLVDTYNVVLALNGTEALAKLKSYAAYPDLIVSDVMMDKMDGFKFASVLSEIPEWRHIPFIFLTAKSTPGDKLIGLELGAVDYIQKPFSTIELLQKVSSILENRDHQKTTMINTMIHALNKMGSRDKMQEDIVSKRVQNHKIFNLSGREIEIIQLVRQGITYKQIAENLCLSEKTIDKHIQNIFLKIKVTNKTQLLLKLDT